MDNRNANHTLGIGGMKSLEQIQFPIEDSPTEDIHWDMTLVVEGPIGNFRSSVNRALSDLVSHWVH